MSNNPIITDAELYSFIDGELGEIERQRVADAVRVDMELQNRVAAIRLQNEGLKVLFANAQNAPSNVALLPSHVSHSIFQLGAWRHDAKSIAASLAILGLGFLGGWGGHMITGQNKDVLTRKVASVAIEGAQAHRIFVADLRHPVEVGADEEAHLLKWLSNRMGHEISAPDFSQFGYVLIGGRLLPSETGISAQLMYEAPTGDRVTLYARTGGGDPGKTEFAVQKVEKLQSIYWADETLSYALFGEVDRDRLLGMSRVTYNLYSVADRPAKL